MTGREDDPAYLLNRVVRLMRADLAARLKAHGLTPAQWAVLSEVAARPGGARPAAIADAIGMDRPTISGVVARLREAGRIEAAPDPSDRRATRLLPTAAAARELPQLAAEARASTERALAPLPPEDRAGLVRMLRAVAEDLEGAR